MKAVVLETKKNRAAVLSDDGIIAEIRNKGYAAGQSIEMEELSMIKINRRWTKTVAGLAASLVILIGGGTLAYTTPVAHVSVDVNPSIMYSVNAFDRVIAVEMSNTDADVILDTIGWNGEKLSVVIEKTIDALKDKNYLLDKNWYETGLLIGVNSASADREQRLIVAIKNELQDIIFDETTQNVDLDDCENLVVGIGEDRVQQASDLSDELDCDVTPGKLNLVQKLDASLIASGKAPLTDAEIATWINMPVQEIMAQIKANKALINPKTTTEEGIHPDAVDGDEDGDFDDSGDLDEPKTTDAALQTSGDDCSCGFEDCLGSDCLECRDIKGVCTCAVTDAAEKVAEDKADAADRAADAAEEAADRAAEDAADRAADGAND